METGPEMRHHRASGQAIVRIGGCTIYLGAWGSEAAQRRFDDIVAGSRPLSRLVRMLRWAAMHWHPLATRLRAAGARVEDVQAALGHAALSTTEVYAERDLDRIAIIVARASGSL